jgi:hypothetical protein
VALTEELTFMLTDTGVVLNTDSIGQPFVDIEEVFGLDNAPYRETERDHEGTDGGFLDAEFEKGRPILLQGTVYANSSTMEAYLDSLKANYAPQASLVPFYVKAPGVDERVMFVKPQGCKYSWQQLRRTGRCPIQFKMFAEDPRLYKADEVTGTIPFAVGATTGFGFNLAFSFGFGAGGGGTDGEFLTNEGNRPTPVEFTIHGPCETPAIVDDTYGHTLLFNIILATGETLVVNTQYRTVRLNGTLSRRNTLAAPDWFFLQEGSTFIRFRAISGSAPSTMDYRFRSAWR